METIKSKTKKVKFYNIDKDEMALLAESLNYIRFSISKGVPTYYGSKLHTINELEKEEVNLTRALIVMITGSREFFI